MFSSQKTAEKARFYSSVRRFLFWAHLAVGVAVGLVVFFLALTGTLLGFQPQLTRLAERGIAVHPRRSDAVCLTPAAVVQRAQAAADVRAASLTLYADSTRPDLLTVNNRTVYLVDPCDGALLQYAPSRAREFFSDLKDLHRWIAVGGTRHEALRDIKDAANLGFTFLIFSGLVLWFPRKWSIAAVRSAFLFRRGQAGRAREWSLHNVTGFWLAVPLFLISATGTTMAYPWAKSLLYRAAGSPLPKTEEKAAAKAPQQLDNLDALVVAAQAQDGAWQGMMVRLPAEADKMVSVTVDDSLDEATRQRNQLTLSPTGKVVRWEPFQKLPRGRRWLLYARFLHTGELFGVLGQAVATLAAVGGLLLVWTGFSLALRRAASFRERRQRQSSRVVQAA